MSKPWIHAKSSAKRYGGIPEDYLKIHQLMDSSKSTMPDNRHRALTHNAWFIGTDGPLELIFGVVITNSEGKEVSVRDIGEQHILEDFGMRYIPSVSDYLSEMEYKSWMNNGKGEEVPPSHKKIAANKVTRTIKLIGND